MSEAKRGILAVRIYIVLALVTGICALPAVITAGIGACFALGELRAGLRWSWLILLVWSLAGLLGYLAWLRLTMLVSFAGMHNLQAARGYWWLFLLLGIVAALPFPVVFIGKRALSGLFDVIFFYVTGIGLPILAGYLVFLRLRENSAGESR